MLKALHTKLIAFSVVPDAHVSVYDDECRSQNRGDEDDDKAGSVYGGIFWFEEKRTDEVTWQRISINHYTLGVAYYLVVQDLPRQYPTKIPDEVTDRLV